MHVDIYAPFNHSHFMHGSM